MKERHLIETELNMHQRNIAATVCNFNFNVSRTTLQYKVQKYSIHFGMVHN